MFCVFVNFQLLWIYEGNFFSGMFQFIKVYDQIKNMKIISLGLSAIGEASARWIHAHNLFKLNTFGKHFFAMHLEGEASLLMA